MADHVQEILNYYTSDNAGTKTNIARLLRSGKHHRAQFVPASEGGRREVPPNDHGHLCR